MDDVRDIQAYYDQTAEGEEARLVRHRLEFDLTWRLLEEYLPAGARLLEIGCAAGAYTVPLARRGHRITAVDMSRVLLQRCGERLREAGLSEFVTLIAADARDLAAVDTGPYDAVLLMGPLYHLVHEADRLTALNQACARLRPGGVLFSAHISRYGIMGELMRKVPEWIEDRAEVDSVLARGRDPEDYHEGQFRGYFCTVAELAPLHERVGLETVMVAAVEPAISADDASYEALDEPRRILWLDLLRRICAEPSTVGASRHLLYIGLKPEA